MRLWGFDTAAIRQWCIPELDAEMLVEATRAQRPKRILEVGTYVGVSTLLMALADPPPPSSPSIRTCRSRPRWAAWVPIWVALRARGVLTR